MHFHTRLGGKPQSEDAAQKLATLLDRTGWVGDPANGQYRISIVSEREETLEEARECLAAIGISPKIARRSNGPRSGTLTGRGHFPRPGRPASAPRPSGSPPRSPGEATAPASSPSRAGTTSSD